MNSEEYSVLYGDVELARGMTLGTALLLVEAMMQKYHQERGLKYTIKRNDDIEQPDPDEILYKLEEVLGIQRLYEKVKAMKGD